MPQVWKKIIKEISDFQYFLYIVQQRPYLRPQNLNLHGIFHAHYMYNCILFTYISDSGD